MSVHFPTEGGMSSTRLATERDERVRAERDQAARVNLAAFALEQPDPEAWLADMLDALGLIDRPRRACTKPSVSTMMRHFKAAQVLCDSCKAFRKAYDAAEYAARKAAT